MRNRHEEVVGYRLGVHEPREGRVPYIFFRFFGQFPGEWSVSAVTKIEGPGASWIRSRFLIKVMD